MGDQAVQFRLRHHPIDEAHDAGVLGGELAGGVENLGGEGRPNQFAQGAHPAGGIAEAKLGGRHGEGRFVRHQTQVTVDGDRQAAADAIAVDSRNGRLAQVFKRQMHGFDGPAIIQLRFEIGPLVGEFGNIRAGHKGSVAGAGQGNHPHLIILAGGVQQIGGG